MKNSLLVINDTSHHGPLMNQSLIVHVRIVMACPTYCHNFATKNFHVNCPLRSSALQFSSVEEVCRSLNFEFASVRRF